LFFYNRQGIFEHHRVLGISKYFASILWCSEINLTGARTPEIRSRKVAKTLDYVDVAVTEIVVGYVRKFYPGGVISSLEYNSEGVPDEGFFPSVFITFPGIAEPQTIHLNVWIADDPFVKNGANFYAVEFAPDGRMLFK